LTNVDIITDFSHVGGDVIALDATIFAGLSTGTWNAAMFYVGSLAGEGADDRIIYSSGALYFDKDGAGGVDAVKFATLQGAPTDLSFDDFVIVDPSAPVVTTASDRTTTAIDVLSTAVPLEDVLGDGTPVNGTEGHDDIRTKDHDDNIHGNGGSDYIYS